MGKYGILSVRARRRRIFWKIVITGPFQGARGGFAESSQALRVYSISRGGVLN